jgi:hypothetical protein
VPAVIARVRNTANIAISSFNLSIGEASHVPCDSWISRKSSTHCTYRLMWKLTTIVLLLPSAASASAGDAIAIGFYRPGCRGCAPRPPWNPLLVPNKRSQWPLVTRMFLLGPVRSHIRQRLVFDPGSQQRNHHVENPQLKADKGELPVESHERGN